MLIGKAGGGVTSICTADATSLEVWGKDLCGDLMGRLSFTDFFYLLVSGREPTNDQRYFLDLLLISIAEHGLTPTAQAARMTLAADPDCIHGAVAAGILGCGPIVLGTSQECADLFVRLHARIIAGEPLETVVREEARQMRACKQKVPGFGHPLHTQIDPRAQRIFELADQRGVSGPYVEIARAFVPAVAEAWGRPLPINVSATIASVLLDLDFPAGIVKAIPILARTAGLLGHIAEEQQRPTGFLMAHYGEQGIQYRRMAET